VGGSVLLVSLVFAFVEVFTLLRGYHKDISIYFRPFGAVHNWSRRGFGELPGPFFLKKILAVIFPVGCMLFMFSGRCGQMLQNI
jgi:hypothetical protein